MSNEISDWPGFQPGDQYVIAMAGGEGEWAFPPIADHIARDKDRAADGAATDQEVCEILATPDCDWVDCLYVYRNGEEIAEWRWRDGWNPQNVA